VTSLSAARLEQLVALALALAEASGPIIARYFRTGAAIVDKADLSPVTVADREAEAAMRTLIAERMPEAGVFGEEMGADRADAEFVWVLDPIDGTKSFVTGKPLFGTLIGLVHEGRPIVGVLNQPVLDERWIGVAGRPSTFNGQTIRTRACAKLSDAWLYATTPAMFEGDDAAAWTRLSAAVKFPVYGADCYAYGMLASGWTDLVAEALLKPYDWCALVPIIEGAGGRITDWEGRPLGLEPVGHALAAGDPKLHEAALALIRG
jgi:inositol-phosphate phosphatase / L-galactose 1-phosphate phosphatase / histidinol-phosphatase